MAIIEKTGPINKSWEEFVTIKLSKREAAGLLALMGPTPSSSIVPYGLYDKLDDLVGGFTNYGELSISHKECETVSQFLNNTYGNL